MIIISITGPRAALRSLTKCTSKPLQWRHIPQPRTLCQHRIPFRTQLRCYAQQVPRSSATGEALKRQAKAAAKGDTNYEIPERLIIYHAGTGRVTFLAMLKLTSLILGAFFTFLVVPSYVKAEKPLKDTTIVTLCGIVPILFIAYTTAPFVTHIHIHLPPSARISPSVLKRYIASMPPTTQLTLTTMSFIAKPRYSAMQAGDLRPATTGKRLGLVNYVRDTTAEKATRKWYMYRAVGKFYIQDAAGEAGKERVRYQKKKKTVVDTWIWDAVKEKIAKRAGGVKSS